MVEHAGATGLGKKLRSKTDQRTGGNDIVEPDPTGAVVRHVLHRGLASTEELGHGANVLLRYVDGEPFGRLVKRAVDLLSQHLGLADRELEALTPHRLDEDRKLKLATTLDFPGIGTLGRQHPDRHIADEFRVETALDEAGGELLTLLTSEW